MSEEVEQRVIAEGDMTLIAYAGTFRHWCRQMEPNPRFATLVVFLEINYPEVNSYAQKIWDLV